MSRRLAREVALRTLFQIEVGHSKIDDALQYNVDELALESKSVEFASQLCRGVLEHQAALDGMIEQYAVDWTIDRMPYIDRNILRLATYELSYEPNTPASVAVNEAVELAKTYGDVNSSRFINGILGNLLRSGQVATAHPNRD